MLEQALSSVKETLEVDGYLLTARQPKEGIIEVTIEAQPNACVECLVPKIILEKIISAALQESGIPYKRLKIKMP